jgi:type I restriction enzyme S subunit
VKPYASYKASGVPWLGDVPVHWEVKKAKHITHHTTGWTPPTGDSASYEGNNPWATIGDLGEPTITETRNSISDEAVQKAGIVCSPPGSLLFSFKLSVGQVSIAGMPLFTNEAIATFLPTDDYVVAWAFYAFPAFIPENCATNIYGAKLLNQQRINDATLVVPLIEEQQAIADYLDTETARIDALMGEKERLIVLLKEHRQSVASDAVMRGLRPDVVTRQVRGGLGSIPDHWRLVPLKRFVKVLGGNTPSTENPAYWDGDVPWVSPKDMKREVLTDSIDHVTDKAVSECGLAVIPPDATLVVVRGMILAHSFPVARNSVLVTINQDMKALRPISDVLPEYLPWLLRGVKPIVLSLTEQSAHGTLALRTDKFFGEPLPIPPQDEQVQIMAFLTTELPRIDDLLRHTSEEIKLLKELRAATIADAVLGRVDVRTVATASAVTMLNNPSV